VRKLWKSRLPKSIEVALVAVDTKDHAEQLRIADRLWECTQSSGLSEVNTRARVTCDSASDEIRREISELRDMIKKMSNLSQRQHRDHRRSFSRERRNFQSPSRDRKPFCWYHYRYGNGATKCVKPCNFSTTRVKHSEEEKN